MNTIQGKSPEEEAEYTKSVAHSIMNILGCTAEMLVEQHKPIAEALMAFMFGNKVDMGKDDYVIMWEALRTTPARNYWLRLSFKQFGVGATYEKYALDDSEKVRAMSEILGGRDA